MSIAVSIAGLLRRAAGRTRVAEGPVSHWAGTRATTRDGLVADLHVDLSLRPVGVTGSEAEVGRVLDALEDELRQLVLAARLEDLPVAGDVLTGLTGRTVAGFLVDRAVVIESEVSVTPELRRLAARDPSAGMAWT